MKILIGAAIIFGLGVHSEPTPSQPPTASSAKKKQTGPRYVSCTRPNNAEPGFQDLCDAFGSEGGCKAHAKRLTVPGISSSTCMMKESCKPNPCPVKPASKAQEKAKKNKGQNKVEAKQLTVDKKTAELQKTKDHEKVE